MVERRKTACSSGILSAGRSWLGLLVVCVIALAGSVVTAISVPARTLSPPDPGSLTIQPNRGPLGTLVKLSGHCPPAYVAHPPNVRVPTAGIGVLPAFGPNVAFYFPNYIKGFLPITGGSFSALTQVPNAFFLSGLNAVSAECEVLGTTGFEAVAGEQVAQLPPTTFCVTPDPACNLSPWPFFLESQMLRWSGFAGVLIDQFAQPFLPAASPTTTTTTSTTTTPSQRSGSGGPPPPAGGSPPPPVGTQPSTTPTTCPPGQIPVPGGGCFHGT